MASPFARPLRRALSVAKGLRVNSASRVRGWEETMTIRNYAGHQTSVELLFQVYGFCSTFKGAELVHGMVALPHNFTIGASGLRAGKWTTCYRTLVRERDR